MQKRKRKTKANHISMFTHKKEQDNNKTAYPKDK